MIFNFLFTQVVRAGRRYFRENIYAVEIRVVVVCVNNNNAIERIRKKKKKPEKICEHFVFYF